MFFDSHSQLITADNKQLKNKSTNLLSDKPFSGKQKINFELCIYHSLIFNYSSTCSLLWFNYEIYKQLKLIIFYTST